MSYDHTQTHLAWTQRVNKEQRDADWFLSSPATPRGALTPRWQELNRMMQPDYATNFDFIRSRTTIGVPRPASRADVARLYLDSVQFHHSRVRFAFTRNDEKTPTRKPLKQPLSSQTALQQIRSLQAVLKSEKKKRQLAEVQLLSSRPKKKTK